MNNQKSEKNFKKIVSQDFEPDNILRIFLNFTNFEPHYSYKIYSYEKKIVQWDYCVQRL